MYSNKDHIEEAKDGKLFGHRGQYKYRVYGKDGVSLIHHTNNYIDAVLYLRKCRHEWIASDA